MPVTTSVSAWAVHGPAHGHDPFGTGWSIETIAPPMSRGWRCRAADVGQVDAPDRPDPELLEQAEAVVEVVDLEDRHVAAVAAAPVEQPAGRRAVLGRRDHLEELVTDRHQGVVQAERGDAGIAEADVQRRSARTARRPPDRARRATRATWRNRIMGRHLESRGDIVDAAAMMGRCSSATTSSPGWCSRSVARCSSATSRRSSGRPERPQEEGALERAPVARSVVMAVVGLVAAVWALASLFAG